MAHSRLLQHPAARLPPTLLLQAARGRPCPVATSTTATFSSSLRAPLIRRYSTPPPRQPHPPPQQPQQQHHQQPQPQQPSQQQQKRQWDTPRRSFREELTGSITQRLAKEKQDRARAAQRLQRSEPAWRWAFTFTLVFTALASYTMGTYVPRETAPSSTLKLADTDPPVHNTKKENLMVAWAELAKIVGEENVSTRDTDLAHHASSAWTSHPADVLAGTPTGIPDTPADAPRPFCVVYPASTDEVAAIMKVCHERRIPVTAFSGGTSLEGGYAPTRGGVCVDFSRMASVVALHKDDLDVVVQPGVTWEALNHHLAPHGLFFPPDPSPGAMIGGMVGTGCSGTNAHRYGTMREWVLRLTAVLADGTVIRTRQRARKSSAGYDLTRLLVGSEGTLALVTEATLRLAVVPPHTSVAVASFPSVRAAAACAAAVVARGVPVAAVELLDDVQMACINAAGTTAGRSWAEAPTLFFKFSGQSERGVREQVDAARDAAKATGARAFEFAKRGAGGGDEADALWSARKEALWSAMAVGGETGRTRVWTGDVAVPVGRLADIVEETRAGMREGGLFGTIVGHVGDGNFHVIMIYNDEERPKVERLMHNMAKRAIEMEGTVTGEHGVGLVKRDYLGHELGVDAVDLMRKIKKAFDPLCLLNCDKVVRMQRPRKDEVVQSWT